MNNRNTTVMRKHWYWKPRMGSSKWPILPHFQVTQTVLFVLCRQTSQNLHGFAHARVKLFTPFPLCECEGQPADDTLGNSATQNTAL